MSNSNFLGRAIDTVKKVRNSTLFQGVSSTNEVQAVESDTAGEYEKAYQLYYQACESELYLEEDFTLTYPQVELFMLVLKCRQHLLGIIMPSLY